MMLDTKPFFKQVQVANITPAAIILGGYYLGRFVPYLLRPRLRSPTPVLSSAPRTI